MKKIIVSLSLAVAMTLSVVAAENSAKPEGKACCSKDKAACSEKGKACCHGKSACKDQAAKLTAKSASNVKGAELLKQ